MIKGKDAPDGDCLAGKRVRRQDEGRNGEPVPIVCGVTGGDIRPTVSTDIWED